MHSGGTTGGDLYGGAGSTVMAASPGQSLQAAASWLQAQAAAVAVSNGAPGVALPFGLAIGSVGVGVIGFLLILIYLDRRILE